mgnify:FL=1
MQKGWGVLAAKFTPEEQEKSRRQSEWRERAEASARAAAGTRLKDLDANESGIARAVETYGVLDRGDLTDVRIRSEFVHLGKGVRTTGERDATWDRERDIASRPPMTKLIAAAGSRALPLYLTALYLAQLQPHASTRAFVNELPNTPRRGSPACWVDLGGMRLTSDRPRSPSDNRRRWRRSLTTAIDSLVDYRLVSLTKPPGRAGGYDQFQILREDGTQRPYVAAGEGAAPKTVVRVPSAFFYNGWHLALTPAEIATLLVIADRTERFRATRRTDAVGDAGVDLKESVRWSEYGLSDEAYNSVHMLHQLGLIGLIDPMPDRARPLTVGRTVTHADGSTSMVFENRSRIPFRLIYPPEGRRVDDLFNERAFDVVRQAVADRTT